MGDLRSTVVRNTAFRLAVLPSGVLTNNEQLTWRASQMGAAVSYKGWLVEERRALLNRAAAGDSGARADLVLGWCEAQRARHAAAAASSASQGPQ